MRCKKCGTQLVPDETNCLWCGEEITPELMVQETGSYNNLCVIGFCLALASVFVAAFGCLGLAAFIISKNGRKACLSSGEQCRGLALAGEIIGMIMFVIWILLLILAGWLLWSFLYVVKGLGC